MSAKTYRLLRNNREEGPFTFDELIQKNLRTYDLIWIDGRSAAWSYPGELAEFKIYAPLPGDEQANTLNSRQKNTAISASVQAAIAMNENIAKVEKPRYRVSAAWSKIQTITRPSLNETVKKEKKESSAKKNMVNPTSSEQAKSLSWEEAWLDWEKEKLEPGIKSTPISHKNISSKQPDKTNDSPVLEIKYQQPLDSLKDKYIENILQQKTRTRKNFSVGKFSEFIIPSLALIIVFSGGFWLLHRNDKNAEALNISGVKKETPAVSNINTAAQTEIDNADNLQQVVSTEKQNAVAMQPAFIDKAQERKIYKEHSIKPAATAVNIDKDKTTLPKQTVSNASSDTVDKNAKQVAAEIKNVSGSDNLNNKSAAANDVSSNPKPYKKTGADYINMLQKVYANNGIASIKIQNISDADLDMVVIDVQYFNAANHYYKGETFYLHNLRAGRNAVIKTPVDFSAAYLTSKVSLISSDAKQVYVVGDN